MKIRTFFKFIEKFITLTENECEYLKSMLDLHTYKKKEYILKKGDLSKYSCFILSGCTKKYYINDDGNSQIIQLAVESWWTGDFESYITHSISRYNVQCIEDTLVVRFTLESVAEIIEQVPVFERFLNKSTEFALIEAQNKAIQATKWSAKERYIYFAQKHPEIIGRVPQYLIASYLGMSKQFFSTMKKGLTV